MIPDYNNALGLLKKSGCSEQVIRHCLIVADYAGKIAVRIKDNGYCVDVGLIITGALLHDIGRSRTHDIRHGIEGALLGKEYGLDERIINIIKNHIGAGIRADDTIDLGLPMGDYIPVSLEEKIVAHADNLVEDDVIVSIATKVDILKKKGRHVDIIAAIIALNNEIDEMLH